MHTATTTDRDSKTFSASVARQAARTPDAPALVLGDRRLTFRQMQARSNRVANYLRARGISHASRVGLHVQRGEDQVENLLLLLGIMQVAAYVPLDSELPPDRLAAVLSDADISLVLTPRRLVPKLADTQAIPVLCWDELEEELAQSSADELDAFAQPAEEDIAYILYTSGTTRGKPKGVMVGQRSLAYFTHAQNEALLIRPGDRSSQFLSLGFDASFSELSQLAAGAALYPVPADALLGGQSLLQFLQDNAITVGTFIPSVWMSLPSHSLPALRLLVVGGEVCPATLVQRWARPGLRIFNAFGLTETTVCFSLGECINDGAAPGIGRPFPGITVTVRGKGLQPLPVGEAGQLCVSGPCLALGYTDPDLTAERFVSDPLPPHDRLFVTRDRGVENSDGTFRFLERLDKARRLKLPGAILVELDEIEALLLAHPAVRECAVDHVESRILAYVALRQDTGDAPMSRSVEEWEQIEWATMLELDRHLRRSVPGYALPQAYAILSSLPRSTSGKIDRNALLAEVTVTWMQELADGAFRCARTRVERVLAEIVADIRTRDLQEYALAKREATLAIAGESETAEEPQLPVVTWEQINVAQSPYQQRIDSGHGPRYTLDILARLGADGLENREIYAPIEATALAIEFILAQQSEPEEPEEEGVLYVG